MKILFLDCDGTIHKPKSNSDFIMHPHDQELMEGVSEALTFYKDWLLIGITNQGGVAAGKKSLADAIEEQMITLKLANLDCIYFCPNYHGLECTQINAHGLSLIKQDAVSQYGSFRKPGPGMINRALSDFEVDRNDCWFVGDRSEDEQAALAASVSFCPAEAWRSRFCKGLQEITVTRTQLEFLEGVKLS